MSEKLQIVTIDGPSGVGKSTVSRGLADRLGFVYLDTGAMYRAVAYGCREGGVDVEDEQAVGRFLQDLHIELLPPKRPDDDVRVFLGGQEISGFIRTPEMGMLASKVSALPVVRQKLTVMQQKMGRAGKIVAEGRDTGTVVFPQAAWKFYLDADPEERARRRINQLTLKGERVDEQEILAQIIKRDRDDSERTIAPLKAADDAVRIDASRLSA
ncbi:MAG: (d)CMP kinase, partial [Desulfobulbaceae bacterium]|nr:(d)CMP kinase [Desulfobulbaceae bacterium]